MRERALDLLKESKQNYKILNPLFSTYMPIFDQVFSRGEMFDLDYYVNRKYSESTFEKYLLNNLVGIKNAKICILKGKVGTGKTSLSRYIAEKLAYIIFPESLIIYVDLTTISNHENLLGELTKYIIQKTGQECKKKSIFKNSKEFYKDIFSYLGYGDMADAEIFKRSKKIDEEEIVDYLMNSNKFDRILLILDNIDENSKISITQTKAYALRIQQFINRYGNKTFSILINIRDYLANIFNDVQKFAFIEITEINQNEVIKSRFMESYDKISNTLNKYKLQLTYTLSSEQSRTFIIDKENSMNFLLSLVDLVYDKYEDETKMLIFNISSGNLKVIVANLYNLIHSYKLPIIGLFGKSFIPNTAHEYRNYKNIKHIPYSLGVECLLAVHYPFYDIEAANIMNVYFTDFNIGKYNYKNTLSMIRMLFLIMHNTKIRYKALLEKMKNIGYDENIMNTCINKAFNFGLISSDHGYKVEHLDNESVIICENATEEYLKKLMFEVSYIQYICEDTPMENEFIVPIEEKYRLEYSSGSKGKRMLSVRRFIEFFKKEEEDELKEIKEIYDVNSFLTEYSVIKDGMGRKITSILLELTKREIGEIENF